MKGLYTVAQIARYFGSRPQEVARMIREDGLPAVELPGEKQTVKKITLHGLHGWMAKKHSGTAFMSVEELAAEIAAANGEERMGDPGLRQLRSCMELIFAGLQKGLRKEAA